ncbi:hypothetical protein OAK59_01840 [Akkermansiaceae bacterium]|nr:hypothetical protein [Akkermansiaceae bacterium]
MSSPRSLRFRDQRLPTNSQGKEVESSDANGDDENDNRKSHNFNVIDQI